MDGTAQSHELLTGAYLRNFNRTISVHKVDW